MEDGIELDDIRVVNVTGTAYKDRRPRGKKSGCSSPSLRVSTILLFLFIALVYLAAVAVFIVRMRINLEDLDREAGKQSIDRFASLFFNDIVKMKQLTRKYAWSQISADAARDPYNETAFLPFLTYYFNTTMNVNPNDGTITYDYALSSLINYWALIDNTTFKVVQSEFHPALDASGLPCVPAIYPEPFFPPGYLRNVITSGRTGSAGPMQGWMSLFAPDIVHDPLFVSIEAIMIPNEFGVVKENETVYGYLMTARTIKNRLYIFADDVPGCISMISNEGDEEHYDETDMKYWAESEAGAYVGGTFNGKPVYAQREASYLDECPIRVCPAVPLFNDTDNMMTSYFHLCGIDPKISNQTTCIYFRMDRPMSMVEQGTVPVVNVSIEVVVIMVVLCVAFLIFLDCVVLRRIAALSDVIRKQTRGHREATKDVEDDTATASVADDRRRRSRGKKGKSARGSAENSQTTTSSDGGEVVATSTRDELGNLKRVMEQNALGLRKRLEAVNESIKIEQQKAVRHKQAMQLLNLWCGRKDFFPGLRPNAMQLRYEPNRSLDDLLASPLAIEYLKSHCDTDRTLENLWFLLDVSWLEELEAAEDSEQDAEKRKQIHEVADACAMTILSRYIAVNAPQQINVSASTFKSLREKGEVYERKMFEPAVSEVKLMLNTDILPRFQKSAAYSAMSETLFIDNSGGGDESEFSDETVSTAGSILTDEGSENEGGGVARVFAHTFKNLHNTFDANPDTDNSSTYSADSSRATNTLTSNAPVTASLAAGTETTTGTGAQEKGTSVSSEEEVKKQPPKAVELGKKVPEKKDESDSSSDSSDSSSNSVSSDSMTMSGSDSSSD